MADAAPGPQSWTGVSEFEVARLLRRGRDRGSLGLDEVIDVLRDAEITPDLIADVRRRLKVEGIEFDETVVLEAGPDEVTRLARASRAEYRVRPESGNEPGGATDSTRLYLREIGQVALLTAREEVELADAITSGVEAEGRLADLAASGELGLTDRAELASLKRLQRRGDRARDRLTRATCDWWCRWPRSTGVGGCPSWTSSRRGTWG